MFIMRPDRPDRVKIGEPVDRMDVHTVPSWTRQQAAALVGGADRRDRVEPAPWQERFS